MCLCYAVRTLFQWRRELVISYSNHGISQTAFIIKPNWLYSMIVTDIQVGSYNIDSDPEIEILTPLVLYYTMIEENFQYIRVKCNSQYTSDQGNSLTFVCIHT